MTTETGKPAAPTRWITMGVSGCGKSEIGAQLAAALHVPFLEGDTLHPQANVQKMSTGLALTDADRCEWLLLLQARIRTACKAGSGLVISCSALKRRYRDVLRAADPGLRFAYLVGDRELIAARMRSRVGHYMPLSLLESQLRDLEPLQDDEAGVALDIRKPPAALIDDILRSQAAL